jgi:hypothetical protein
VLQHGDLLPRFNRRQGRKVPHMRIPEPYGIHTLSIRFPYARNPFAAAETRGRRPVPPRPAVTAPHGGIIRPYPPEIPAPYQQVVPRNLRCCGAISLRESLPFVTVCLPQGERKDPGGSQTARNAVRGGNGTSEPGCHGSGTGPEGKLQVSEDIGKFPEGKAGASRVSSSERARRPGAGGLRPSGSGRRQGRVARHDAKTASEHLTPVPANGNGARHPARAPSLMRTASMHLCRQPYTRRARRATTSGLPGGAEPHMRPGIPPHAFFRRRVIHPRRPPVEQL